MRKSFARNAVLLGISTISVRLMGFLFRLLLAHQLTARELGVYQLVLPVVGSTPSPSMEKPKCDLR